MKFSVGFAAFSLFLAAAAEANALYNVVLHKRHGARAHARDIANPSKRCRSASAADPASSPAKSAHKHPLDYSPLNEVAEAACHTQSRVIHVDPGECGPIGATSELFQDDC
jgi:hypothetical protein